MIVTLKDPDDKVITYIEYRLVDHRGLDSEVGRWIWINNIWIHKSLERQGILRKLMRDNVAKYPTAKWFYFKRTKYNGRIRKYEIRRFI